MMVHTLADIQKVSELELPKDASSDIPIVFPIEPIEMDE